MRTNVSEFIDKLGKIIENPDGKSMMLLMPPDGAIYLESEYFTAPDIQRFMHLLSRTHCDWYIHPSQVVEKGVRLAIKLY